MDQYIGRFAPSPSGPLHAGSLVAAMASYLDARAHNGIWLVRIEDVDEARTVVGATEEILASLVAHGIQWDGEVVRQTTRYRAYEQAIGQLGPHVFACACTRKEISDSQVRLAADGAAIYPGTCRNGIPPGRSARARRLRVPEANCAEDLIIFEDRWLGTQSQSLSNEVGDFVLVRADGYWAYQLAVVVDDAFQGVTHIVRGVDLLDSSARQIYLQRLLGFRTPKYMHVPLVFNATGEKLSKQTGAMALNKLNVLPSLIDAARILELNINASGSVPRFWELALQAWKARWNIND